jgi:threonine dehydrogenase-like Zn-dependent dehydrogenase
MVLGAGTVGLLWSQLLRNSPITTLIQTEIIEFRRKLADELAADITINPTVDDVIEEVYSVCPDGIDYIIDASGDPEAVEQAIHLVAKSGTVMIFGICPEDETITISPNLVYQKEMKIIASKMPPQTLDRSAKLLESGIIEFDKIVNTILPLERIGEALDMFHTAKNKVVKMAIDPWQ